VMIPGFEKIVEERIRKAQEAGEFDNLKGRYQPLCFDDLRIPEEWRLSCKILKNAGFLPPELELRNEISRTGLLLESLETGDPERRKIQKKLNYLFTRLETMRGRLSPLLLENYRENVLQKLS
jgi:hypothetical protein